MDLAAAMLLPGSFFGRYARPRWLNTHPAENDGALPPAADPDLDVVFEYGRALPSSETKRRAGSGSRLCGLRFFARMRGTAAWSWPWRNLPHCNQGEDNGQPLSAWRTIRLQARQVDAWLFGKPQFNRSMPGAGCARRSQNVDETHRRPHSQSTVRTGCGNQAPGNALLPSVTQPPVIASGVGYCLPF